MICQIYPYHIGFDSTNGSGNMTLHILTMSNRSILTKVTGNMPKRMGEKYFATNKH